jgi:hypothetical protein
MSQKNIAKIRTCENCGYNAILTAKQLIRHWEQCIKKPNNDESFDTLNAVYVSTWVKKTA